MLSSFKDYYLLVSPFGGMTFMLEKDVRFTTENVTFGIGKPGWKKKIQK